MSGVLEISECSAYCILIQKSKKVKELLMKILFTNKKNKGPFQCKKYQKFSDNVKIKLNFIVFAMQKIIKNAHFG